MQTRTEKNPVGTSIKTQLVNSRLEEMAAREKILAGLRTLNLGLRATKLFCETELGYNATETRLLLAALGLVITSDTLTSSDPVIRLKIEKLRDWRRTRSRERGLPAYRILSNRALLEVASKCLKSHESFQELKGFGKKTAEAYGPELLELLKCEPR